jgi:cysteine synthase
LGCESIAIVPKSMSRERFDWLACFDSETLVTPGVESGIKEMFDQCRELRQTRRDDVFIFNQFDEFGNYLWHYEVTGHAMQEVLERKLGPRDTYRGVALSPGSAGTMACGDYMKELFPASKIAVSEALQSLTLLLNGFGKHRIEGIGDRHIPWIYNVKNTDLIAAIDDEACVSLIRLFNEPAGRAYLLRQGVPEELVGRLDWLGISSVANLLAAVKFARWYELGENDVVLTVLTDSIDLYHSRLEELGQQRGPYTEPDAAADYHRFLLGCTTDYMEELTYPGRRRRHNLKYFTWVEQEGKTEAELHAQWYDPDYWTGVRQQAAQLDELIVEFNERVGVRRVA